ncbi:hypothetical protein RM697_00960 [Ichthyenterobacterium sp. W332]|uniref:Lipocalin-like domain-containing protein n=1 Tax=Microcosmobacter mediterraneus TaxID=3075607 RepID=A0ABU2YG90_9FLAO|nr:lipocalin family protein [Ichthyenterobacterium sp. W332]MDT0557195.1 hypothetical protein [Ichthyenterobacterium sp. W332]
MKHQLTKYTLLFVIIACVFSCKKDAKAMIPHITGYWEIEKVINANNEERTYTVNQVIDYFIVNDSLEGFRKKLKPNFNGGYETSDDKEPFTLLVNEGEIMINYKTLYDEWQETIASANETQMIIVNDLGTQYIYKRFEGININE